MIISSTLCLVVYLFYLVIQKAIFTSCSFNSSIPWASLERDVSLIKVALRLLLSFAFNFDKVGNSKPIVSLVCFFLSGILTFKRLTSAFFFNASIHRANLVYDLLTTILFLCSSIHQLSGNPLTVFSLAVLVFAGIFVALLLHSIADQRLMREPLVFSMKPESAYPERVDNIIRILYRYQRFGLSTEKDTKDCIILAGIF